MTEENTVIFVRLATGEDVIATCMAVDIVHLAVKDPLLIVTEPDEASGRIKLNFKQIAPVNPMRFPLASVLFWGPAEDALVNPYNQLRGGIVRASSADLETLKRKLDLS